MGLDLRHYTVSARSTPAAPQRHVTQATFPSHKPVASHNSLHAHYPSGTRTGFGVHAPSETIQKSCRSSNLRSPNTITLSRSGIRNGYTRTWSSPGSMASFNASRSSSNTCGEKTSASKRPTLKANTASLGCLAWSWLEAMDDDGVQESGRCWFGVFSGLETVVGPTAFAGRAPARSGPHPGPGELSDRARPH